MSLSEYKYTPIEHAGEKWADGARSEMMADYFRGKSTTDEIIDIHFQKWKNHHDESVWGHSCRGTRKETYQKKGVVLYSLTAPVFVGRYTNDYRDKVDRKMEHVRRYFRFKDTIIMRGQIDATDPIKAWTIACTRYQKWKARMDKKYPDVHYIATFGMNDNYMPYLEVLMTVSKKDGQKEYAEKAWSTPYYREKFGNVETFSNDIISRGEKLSTFLSKIVQCSGEIHEKRVNIRQMMMQLNGVRLYMMTDEISKCIPADDKYKDSAEYIANKREEEYGERPKITHMGHMSSTGGWTLLEPRPTLTHDGIIITWESMVRASKNIQKVMSFSDKPTTTVPNGSAILRDWKPPERVRIPIIAIA